MIYFNTFSQVKVTNNYTAPNFVGSVKVQDTLGIINILLTDTIGSINGITEFKDDIVLDSTLSIGILAPNVTAIIDITSTTKGMLYPRMTTTQRNAIGSPATGLSVYNTTNNDPNFFNGSAWRRITHAPGSSLKIGAVIFATGVSALDGDSANFFWDNANNRLGIVISDPD